MAKLKLYAIFVTILTLITYTNKIESIMIVNKIAYA